MHDHVCVKDDETTEHQSSTDGQYKLKRFTPKEYLESDRDVQGMRERNSRCHCNNYRLPVLFLQL